MDDSRSETRHLTPYRKTRSRPPIAVIGVSGRYPGGANDLEALWEKLKSGTDCVSEARGDHWDLGYHNPDPEQQGRIYTRRAGFLDQIDQFDADFFAISPREASHVDPQQRLLLELAWEALEDAALVPRQLAGSKTGVFIGAAGHDYADIQHYVAKDQGSAYTNSGGALSIAANRISYNFDFHGPSFAVDTACSSGLVAFHQACVALWTGECTLALAGAINILAQPKPFIGFCNASMLSPLGRCASFDAAGDGYVRSEGGGIFVLKLLADAERDGDPIQAVILGSGTNSDGRTNGLSLPNEVAQEMLLREVYDESGIAPEDVFYVEAHGTGTVVGDPIECNALGRVLGAPRRDGTKCLIGSIKSNIGHLETASGAAGLTKVLLALRHRELPPNLHYQTPNPRIAFDELGLEVVDRVVPLPEREQPLIMGVSSYGFGGANAHIIVGEYRRPASSAVAATDGADSRMRVLQLSARSSEALTAMSASYAAFLRAAEPDMFDNICATAALHRSRHPYRLAVAGETIEAIAARLDRNAAGESTARLATAKVTVETPRLAFVFSGNGPQWWGMGRELLAAEPRFRAEIERVDALFKPLSGWSLIAEMQRPEGDARMDKTEVAQPTLFALQLGIVAWLEAAGIRPAAVIGHSVGEVAGAYVSGALSLPEAVKVIYERSQAQGLTAGRGKMAAVGLGPEQIAEAIAEIPGWIELAAINSGRSVTVAGDPEALEALGRKLTEAGVFYRLLALDYAFHSRAMEDIEAPLLRTLADLRPQPTRIPFVSTVAGQPLDGNALGADYWWHNIRDAVRFGAGVNYLLSEAGVNNFIEIGPHPVLRDYVLQCARDREAAVAVIPTLRRPAADRLEPECDNMWTAVCACHANGVIDPDLVYGPPAERAALPLYPFQRRRFWSGVNPLPDSPVYSFRDHPLLGYRVPAADGMWENLLDTSLLPFLLDHVVQGAVVFPATGYIEMALAAAARLHGEHAYDIEDLDIRKALVISAGQMPIIQCALSEEDGSLKIRSRPNLEASWTLQVAGRVSAAPVNAKAPTATFADLRGRMKKSIDKATHYRVAAAAGLAYGPAFQALEKVWVGAGEALGEICVPDELVAGISDYRGHPSLLDACLQTLLGLIGDLDGQNSAYLPVQLRRLRSFHGSADIGFCHVRVTRRTLRSILADIRVFDKDGKALVEIEDFRFLGIDFQRASATPLYAEFWDAGPVRPALRGATPLPSPVRLAEQVAPRIAELVTKLDRHALYEEIQPQFDRLSAAYAARGLEALGAREAPFTVASLIARGGVTDEHHRYLNRLIEIAEADGLIDRTDSGWEMPEDRPLPDANALWRALVDDRPDHLAELAILGRSGENIAPVLRGEVSAVQLLFPGKGGGQLDHLYDTAPTFKIYCQIARAAVEAMLREWPADRHLRICEIGGGTGGLTSSLLPILPPGRTEYVFTDVSAAFRGQMEQRFHAYRFIHFNVFDIDRDPAEQDLPAGGFDLVVAADVLHIATDLRKSLGHVRKLLAPGGQLLLIEKHLEWTSDIIFGQLDGWWKFADLDLRANSALLPPEGWQQVLSETGFAEPVVLNDAAAVPSSFEPIPPQHSVIVARNAATRALLAPAPVAEATRRILMLVDPSAACDSLATATAVQLEAAGMHIISVVLGDGFAEEASDRFTVGAIAPGDFSRLLDLLAERGLVCDEIIHLAGIMPEPCRNAADLAALQDLRCISTMLLVQALQASGAEQKPRLTLITAKAVAAPSGGDGLDPAQAPLWGFGRVLANENPDLRCRLIDLQVGSDESGMASRLLASEIASDDGETEVLLTGTERYINRLRTTSVQEQTTLALHQTKVRHVSPPAAGEPAGLRLEFASHGPLDNLFVAEAPRRAPAAGEVEIRVHATGLNFRDVMWVMGMLPEEALENGFAGPTIGMECAGEIVRIGAGVEGFAVGDKVLAFSPACFGTFVTTTAVAAARLPEGVSFEEAATIPATFFTAHYALVHLARLAPGERLLIHGAAGGVGLAAIQIARRCGAEIFGTAGSQEKRDYLRLLGVDHVLDSRTLDFADDVMRITDGRGVDVVLNSLAGEAITKNLNILRPFGRFLEIGKRDFYANSKIGLRPFRNNISYFGIDSDTLLIERRELAGRLLAEVLEPFGDRSLRPLPYRSFPITRAVEAFRQMQQSRQIGKLVVTMDDDDVANVPVIKRQATVRPDGTYVISGGLGGFGLATARWLAEKGARHFALLGRRGATTEEAQTGIAALEAMGATVRACAVDVADEAAMRTMMTTLKAEMPPLRGVIHAAMVLDDAVVVNLDRERVHKVLAPKMLGAWNLHHLTLDQQLDWFVLYSSATTIMGNPGQSNYCAGNMYLEALAEHRRSIGLPALSVSWGAIADVGYVACNMAVNDLLRSRSGLEGMSPQVLLAELDRLLAADATRVAVARLDWRRLSQLLPVVGHPRLSLMLRADGKGEAEVGVVDMKALLAGLPSAEHKDFVVARLKEQIGRVLGTTAEQIDTSRPLSEMGLDSLMAVELGEVIERDMQLNIPILELIQSGTVNAMADRILKVIGVGSDDGSRGGPSAVKELAEV